jgi:hypothetical protein
MASARAAGADVVAFPEVADSRMRLLLAAFFLGASALAGPAAACQCGTIPGTAEALARSQVVFAGEVLFFHTAPASTAAKKLIALRVDRVWKGTPPPVVTLLSGKSDCDYDQLERGDSYLLFADRLPGPDGHLTASRCLPTRRLRRAAAQVAALGPGRAVLHTRAGGGAWRLLRQVAAGLCSLGLGIYVFHLRTR